MTGDDEQLDDIDAAIAVGGKVLEMVQRVQFTERFQHGAEAQWSFELDGVRYAVSLRVAA